METDQCLASPMSPNTTGTGADEDTIGSITKDFSSNFAHKFTPLTWSKNLQTPTPNTSRMIDSNMSSVTCLKHANFNGENETPMVNQTPMRDLNPDYQDGPNVHCPLSVDSQISSSSLESPPVVKVLSPATQFRLKRAVFESKAKAVKSPSRKQRAQNVTVLEGSPSLPLMMYADNDVSPSCAIESELGEEESDEVCGVPTAQAMPFSVTMKVMQTELITESDEVHEKEECTELQYEPPVAKEKPVMVQTEEESEVLPVYPARSNVHSNKPILYILLAVVVGLVYYSSAYFLNPTVVSVHITPSAIEIPVSIKAPTDVLIQPEADNFADFEETTESEMLLQDAEMSLSVVYKSAFLREATRARALYVQFRQVCSTQLAHLQTQIHLIDAAHGSHLHKATVQLRGQAEVYLAALGQSVAQFHHQIDALGIKHEYLKLKDEVSTRVEEYLEKSGANELLALVKQQYQVHAPIVKQRVATEVQKAQQHTVTKMLQLHHFIKANELLADEFY